MSNKVDFGKVYSAFIIRPYFRYLEVIDFVCSKGKEKYERLAQWMGFQNEFDFQEEIARGIQQAIKDYEKKLADKVISANKAKMEAKQKLEEAKQLVEKEIEKMILA